MKLRKIIAAATVLGLVTGIATAAEFEKGEDGGILIPPNAEMLLYSGSINFAMPEGCGFRGYSLQSSPRNRRTRIPATKQ